jgi:hypothetical protein
VGDEAFHLLAAKLIAAGRTPYRDFFYQHPPLFVYLVAGIFRLSGVGWRVAHIFSTASLVGAIVLAALYARSLFVEEDLRWRNAALVPVLLGLNCYVLVFAPTGLPFGFCLFCLTASLFLSRSDRKTRLYFSGVFAGAAAASSFLTVPVLPVFVVWLWQRERNQALWFLAGVATALISLLLLLFIAPEQTLRDVVGYHFLDRPWHGWRFNLREIAGWIVTLQGLTLVLLSVAAVRLRRDDEVRLCGWLALALIVSLSLIRTTTSFYFLVVTPFLAILAATSVTELSRQFDRYSKLVPAAVAALYLIGLYDLGRIWRLEAPYTDHRDIVQMAQEVESCAPRGNYYAFDAVYFESRELPPAGMENRFDPNSLADKDLQDGRFDAVLLSADNPRIERFGLARRYSRRQKLHFDGYSMLLFCDRIHER